MLKCQQLRKLISLGKATASYFQGLCGLISEEGCVYQGCQLMYIVGSCTSRSLGHKFGAIFSLPVISHVNFIGCEAFRLVITSLTTKSTIVLVLGDQLRT